MSVSGIIESDDIQIITAEVDKCLNFSKKCQMLIDNVKKKYFSRQRFVSKLHHFTIEVAFITNFFINICTDTCSFHSI